VGLNVTIEAPRDEGLIVESLIKTFLIVPIEPGD